MSQEVSRMKAAWAGFVGSCSWVRIETATFVGGADRLLTENELDATWIANVASAFEAAGSNSLTNQALNFASTAVSPMSDATLLKALAKMPAEDISAILTASPGLQSQLGLIDPVKINEWWAGLNPPQGASTRFSAQQGLLLTSLPILFGNLEGMPYGARDYANQLALPAEIARFEALEAGIKDQPNISIYGPPAGWLAELEKVQVQLAALRDIRNALKSPATAEPRYLISMTQDQPPLAAVSIGDLDAAASVTYAVPGMGATTIHMTGWAKSSQNLQSILPSGSAVVAWIGYKTPAVPSPFGDLGVLDLNYAVGGGDKLAAGLGGLAAVRGDSKPDLSIVAHSYGTTTAAVALTHPDVHVENFITVGSAGLPDSLQTASDLNATHVYSGHARSVIPWLEPGQGDQWAWTGTDFSRDHHVNPISPEFESHAFSTDTGGDTGLPVTDHGTSVDENGAGYLDAGTESLRNLMHAIVGEPENMTPYAPKGQTDLQKILEEAASSGNYSY
jgi:pimeloyl-ACP methyl ester carboxylesterase